MKHVTRQFLSLTAVGLVLATGCAAGPQRLPGAGANAPGQNIASTTGDMDACAMALGNLEWNVGGPTTGGLGFGGMVGPAGTATPGDTDRMPPLLRGNAAPQGERAAIPWTTGNYGNALTGGLTNPAAVPIMANGVLIGNIALVALPDDETTPPGNAGAPAGGIGAPTGGAGLPGGGAMVPGGVAGRTVTGAEAVGAPAGAAQVRPAQSAGSPMVALDRIVASCGRLSQIRTVAEGDDEVRMAEITGAIRLGTPITEFMPELTEMNVRATTAWSAPPGTFGMTPGGPGTIGAGAR